MNNENDINNEIVFPISVKYEDGEIDFYDDLEHVVFNLEHFDSEDMDSECIVRDFLGRKLKLRLYYLDLKEIDFAD